VQLEIARCRREIADIERAMQEPCQDGIGLLMGWADWHVELQLLEEAMAQRASTQAE